MELMTGPGEICAKVVKFHELGLASLGIRPDGIRVVTIPFCGNWDLANKDLSKQNGDLTYRSCDFIVQVFGFNHHNL